MVLNVYKIPFSIDWVLSKLALFRFSALNFRRPRDPAFCGQHMLSVRHRHCKGAMILIDHEVLITTQSDGSRKGNQCDGATHGMHDVEKGMFGF